MTNPMVNATEPLPFDFLHSNWEAIRKSGTKIAEEVEIRSDGLSGIFQQQANSISDFFRFNGSFEDALDQPCVLAIANPLAKLVNEDGLSDSDIATGIYEGFCTLSRHGSNHRNLLRIFLYPIALALFAIFGSIFVSFFVMPPFEQLYADFGIMLPAVTSGVIAASRLIRMFTVTILMVVFGLPPLFWMINRIGRQQREPGMSRMDLLLARKRPTTARFLLHCSLLIEAGLEKEVAIHKAAIQSGKRWLIRRLRTHEKSSTSSKSEDYYSFFQTKKLRMADAALATPRSRGQVTAMQQVATWYRDSSSGIIEWWVQLLVPVFAALILLAIFIFILSLFMPLIAVISGLTGGPGGFF